jgi:glucose uptake protein GlcU
MPNALLGAFGAIVGITMFGTNYIPVRRCETHDGLMFGWAMGNGALAVGLCARAIVGGEVLRLGLLGGAIWSLSNALVLPVVKLLGLGVGFALYHGVNLMVGYLVGRLGLFGAPRDTPHLPALCDCSVLILLASLVVMVRVEPDMTNKGNGKTAPPEEPHADAVESEVSTPTNTSGAPAAARVQLAPSLRQSLLSDDHVSSASPPNGADDLRVGSGGGSRRGGLGSVGFGTAIARSESAPTVLLMAPMESPSPAFVVGSASAIGVAISYGRFHADDSSLLDLSLGPPEQQSAAARALVAMRKLTGVLLALFAGLLAGVNAVPFLVWTRYERGADEPALHFLFSDLLGVYSAGSALYIVAAITQHVRGVRYPHSPIRPAYLSGALWAMGCGGQMLAIDNLGMSTAYVLCAIGPVMVSACVSAVVFKEIQGKANRSLFAVAIALQCLGVSMLALGS